MTQEENFYQNRRDLVSKNVGNVYVGSGHAVDGKKRGGPYK